MGPPELSTRPRLSERTTSDPRHPQALWTRSFPGQGRSDPHTTDAPDTEGSALPCTSGVSPGSADPVGQGPPLMDHPGLPAADKRGPLEAPLPVALPRMCDHLLQDRLYHFHTEMAFVCTLTVSYLKTSFEIVPTCN